MLDTDLLAIEENEARCIEYAVEKNINRAEDETWILFLNDGENDNRVKCTHPLTEEGAKELLKTLSDRNLIMEKIQKQIKLWEKL